MRRQEAKGTRGYDQGAKDDGNKRVMIFLTRSGTESQTHERASLPSSSASASASGAGDDPTRRTPSALATASSRAGSTPSSATSDERRCCLASAAPEPPTDDADESSDAGRSLACPAALEPASGAVAVVAESDAVET